MDTLCRVCIDKATKYTSLNTKIEKSSNLTIFDFLNKCASLNACENDKLPQSLCSVCTDSIRRFYAFVKLAEKSDLILRETLNSITTGRFSENKGISYEEITIPRGKEKSEDYNKENLFYCQTNANATGSSLFILDIVKEEPRLSQSPPIAVKLKESNEFDSNLDHPQRSVEESDDILSCLASHLTGILADHSDAEDDVSGSLSKRRLMINENETPQSNLFPKVHGNPSNVKKKTGTAKVKRKEIIKEGASDPKSIRRSDRLINNKEEIYCEEITIKNEEIEVEYADFNKEDRLHCQATTNPTGSSLFILDIVKEEPRISENTSISAQIKDSNEFHSNFHHPEESIEKPDDIISYKDDQFTNIDDHSDSEDNVPISILKERLAKNKETDPQKTKIQNGYKCKDCDLVFNDKETLKIHRRTHVCEKKHECNICGKKFAKRKKLEYHLEIHDGENGYKCAICGKKFKHYTYRRIHMRIHSERPFECNICRKKFGRTDHLKRHMEGHNVFTKKCGQCDREFKRTDTLKKHLKWHANPKPYKCENCVKSFANKCNYTKHMEICKPDDKTCPHTKYKCTECDVLFTDKREFEQHCRNHVYAVTRDKKKKYKCSICVKVYMQFAKFSEHMRIHCGGKPFECKICNTNFTTKYNLKLHLDCHKGSTTKCDQCGKELKNKESLRCHIRWHTNPKPVKCKKCGKSLSRRCNFARHMEICGLINKSKEGTVSVEKSSSNQKETKKS